MIRWDGEVLYLHGEFDMNNAELVENAIAAAASNKLERLVIDMADVTFFDSTGVACLIRARRALAKPHQPTPVVVRNPSSFVDRVLTMTGLVGPIVTVERT